MFHQQSSGRSTEAEGHNQLCFCHSLMQRKLRHSPCFFHEGKTPTFKMFLKVHICLFPLQSLKDRPFFCGGLSVNAFLLDVNLPDLQLRRTVTWSAPQIYLLTFCSLNRQSLSIDTRDTKMSERASLPLGTSLVRGGMDSGLDTLTNNYNSR